MSDHSKVAIFWDYENCNPPSSTCGLGYEIVNNIGRIARIFGSIMSFRAYLDISAQSSKSAVLLRSELQSSGVSMIDCPHNGKKDVVDKMILVDMLAFAVDHPAPATIILIAGDRDYAYAVSILKLRRYRIILVVPSSPQASPSLENQASLVIDWATAILRTRLDTGNSPQAIRQPYVDLDANLVARLLRELQDFSLDDNPLHSCATSHGGAKLRRVSARDLLEPSKHAKNTTSLDSNFAQDFTYTPASPRKYLGAGNDPVPGGPPAPKTPSRSRRASVSTASTHARSATIVASSPPMLEQYTPTRNQPPFTARRSSISTVTDVASPMTRKHSSFVLPPLEALELPLDDDRPPSLIIVRSPLDPGQSTDDVADFGKLVTPSYKLNGLATPFVMAGSPFELDSVRDPCGKQSHTTVKPTSPIIPSTKMADETIITARRTPQMKDLPVTGMEDLTSIQDNGANSERPHRDATSSEMAKSNYHSYSASHARDSPFDSCMSPHLTDARSSNHGSPAIILGVKEYTEPTQLSTFSNVSNKLDHATPSTGPASINNASPLNPTVTESREHNETSSFNESKRRQTWAMFEPLVHLLLAAQARGIARPLRSTIALGLVHLDKQVYRRAGVSKFREYTALAEQANIIELGGKDGDAWITLHSNWFRVGGGVTAAPDHHVLSNSISSPTLNFDPPNATQNSLLMDSKTPLIERTEELFQTPTTPANIITGGETASPPSIPRSHKSGYTFAPAPPTHRQDSHGSSPGVTVPPASFQPLIDFLVRSRAEGSQRILRSVVGQQLNQEAYAQEGVSGFKDYVLRASEAQLVQIGGSGGCAWIGLHPDLRI